MNYLVPAAFALATFTIMHMVLTLDLWLRLRKCNAARKAAQTKAEAWERADNARRQMLRNAGRKGALAGNPKRKGKKRGEVV
jgi:hypothetical protein